MLTLIDGNSLLFRAYYGVHGRLTRSDGTPVNAVFGFCNMVLPLLAASAPGDRFFCVFDAARKNFRNDIYPEYKANRSDTPADLLAQIELTRSAARAMGMPVLVIEGVEADDVIATLTARQCGTGQTRIVTSDKDLMQLVSHCGFLYDGMKEKEVREPQVLEKFGVAPDQVVDVQSLMGDCSDNVPGVPGIGPKKAAELINEFGTLDNLYANIGSVKNDRLRQLLIDNKEKAYISRQLVSLKSDVDLPDFEDGAFRFDRDAFLNFAKNELESNSLVAKANRLFADNNLPPVCVPAANDADDGKCNIALGENYITITTESQLDAFIATVRGVLAIDTETTGLNQMADKIVGISLAADSHTGVYIPIRHQQKSQDLFGNDNFQFSIFNSQLPLDVVQRKLWPILTNPSIVKVGHNLKYDLHILANEGWDVDAIEPVDDTMLLSYVLHGTAHAHNLDELSKIYLDHDTITFDSLFAPKTKSRDKHFEALPIGVATPYAAEDAAVAFALYRLFREKLDKNQRLKKLYENCDRPLLKILLNMERAGVGVDKSKLRGLSAVFHDDMAKLEKEIWDMAGREFNIASPMQLAAVLFEELGLPRRKSTDADTLAEIEHEIAGKILEWRSLSKLAGTYTDALPRQIASDGRIHTTYLQTSTNTGRLSSRDPNLQNIPIKTHLGEQIRKCFVAQPGRVLVSADYSQIQLRLLADVADVKTFKDTFDAGRDIHMETARKIFGIKADEHVPKDLRAKAKTVNFSIIYGISSFGLSAQMGVSRFEAQQLIDSYLAGLPEIGAYIEKTKRFALDNGCVYTPWGRKIELPDVRNPRMRAYALRAAINAPIQGFEADLMRHAMIKISDMISERFPRARMIMQVHDEIVFECDEDMAHGFATAVKDSMESVAKLSVPLSADTSISKEWGK
ncbi:MAG: DNA polymerase I [Alphaproteobacteria bacterium]|nr:DNA polymerase I [Alphaproteobacteria bacterium]